MKKDDYSSGVIQNLDMLVNGDVAAFQTMAIREKKEQFVVACLQRHLGVLRAPGNPSLRSAPAHPAGEKETVGVSVSR